MSTGDFRNYQGHSTSSLQDSTDFLAQAVVSSILIISPKLESALSSAENTEEEAEYVKDPAHEF